MVVSLALDPFDVFKHGVMRARRVNRRRFLAARDALVELRVYGNEQPLRNMLGPITGEHDWLKLPGELWQLGDAVRSACCTDEEDLGLGLHVLFWPVMFPDGIALVDASDRTYSPLWLEAMPHVPDVMHDAAELMSSLPWETPADVGDDAREAVEQLMKDDRERDHEAPLSENERNTMLGILDRWEVATYERVRAFRDELRTLTKKGGAVTIWYEENPAL